MTKKIYLCVLLCVILLSIVGCAETTLPLPIDDGSTVSSTQSVGDSSELSSTQSTTGTSTTSSTPTQSEKIINSGDDNMDDAYKLIVKGKEIAVANHIKLNYEHHYAELPLTAIMKELGAKVEWQSKTTAKITFDGKYYLLDTTKGSLIEIGNTLNILVVAPGSKHGVFYRVVDNEFIIDSDSAKLLLINIMGAKISVDYDHRIVNINTAQGTTKNTE